MQHVVANRIDESAKALRLVDAFFGEHTQHAGEGLLLDVFDGGKGTKAFAQLQPNQFAEVSHKVRLGAAIAGTKAIQVGSVEILKLHGHCRFSDWRELRELALSPSNC